MKNSVWYHKLWKKKLDELSVKEDLNVAWSEMQSILDKDMPLDNLVKGSNFAKIIVSKIVSMFGYILPAAAMITTVTYFVVKEPKPQKTLPKSLNKELLLKTKRTDTLMKDKIINPVSMDSVLATTLADGPIGKASPDFPLSYNDQSNNASDTKILPLLTNQLLTNTQIGNATHPYALLYDTKKSQHAPLINYYSDKNRLKDRDQKNKKEIKKGKSTRTEEREIFTPPYNYGVEAGVNTSGLGKNIYLGAAGNYAINKRWLINAGLRLNIARQLAGQYMHPNYNLDSSSTQKLTIIDLRRLTIADIPLSLEYKISNRISIKAGPVISFQIKQGGPGSKLGTVKNPLDTVYNSKKINSALGNTRLNKIYAGFSGGLNIRIRQFNIEAAYQQNITPYRVLSDMGSYKTYHRALQFGIGYSFK